MKLFKYNENNVDAFIRLLRGSNPLSFLLNFFINIFWALFKLIKKILKKDKIETVIVEEKKVETPLFKLSDFYHYSFDHQKNSLLFIDLKKENEDASGALDYAYRKIKKLEDEYQVLRLCYKRFSADLYLISDNSEIYVDDLALLFKHENIKKICINNLVFNTKPDLLIDSLINLKKDYSFDIEYVFHDYLSLCPSYFLINKEGNPCDMNNCKECLYNNPYRTIVTNDIDEYRLKFKRLFEIVDSFVFFSNFSYEMVLKIYPDINKRSVIVPHEPLMSDKCSKYIKPKDDGIITIGFVGFFHHIKGSDLFIETINKLKEEGLNVKPIVIGYKEEDAYKDLDYTFTGRYNRDNLGKILSDNKVDLVVYPSLNSETYSYIVQELMILNVPLVVLQRGAPAERIENIYKYGVIAKGISADCLSDSVKKLLEVLKDE